MDEAEATGQPLRWVRVISAAAAVAMPMVGCAAGVLPPGAYGIFVDRKSTAFDTKLQVTRSSVTLFVHVSLSRARARTSLECRADVPDGMARKMKIILDCEGERVPYELEWRDARTEWVCTEEEGTPQIMSRLDRP